MMLRLSIDMLNENASIVDELSVATLHADKRIDDSIFILADIVKFSLSQEEDISHGVEKAKETKQTLSQKNEELLDVRQSIAFLGKRIGKRLSQQNYCATKPRNKTTAK